MEIILISGLAGAGKSTALRVLEDNGYSCIDNLPSTLIIDLIKIYDRSHTKLAIGVDARSYDLLKKLPSSIEELNKLNICTKIIFLDARSDVLINRFSETRRKHPLSGKGKTLDDCINEERIMLSVIKDMAHKIDTSDLSANELRNIIKHSAHIDSKLTIVLQSFGFKYGVPIDTDFLFDVRCLPNPYYNKNIRDYTGLDAPIIEFLDHEPKVALMLDDISRLLLKWLSDFIGDNRSYLTVSIGCTGGMHRSVYLIEKLAKIMTSNGHKTLIRHHALLKLQ